MEATQKQVIDKASQKEKRRRLEFLVKLFLFIGVVIWRVYYEDFLENEYRIPKNLINALTFYISAHIIISFTRLMLVAIYLRRHHRQAGFRNNFVIGINQIASLLSFVALVIGVFFLFSIDPKQFFTSISIIAAAIAILFKDYINNMINGLILMFSDHLSIDDYVGIGDFRGRIIDITLMNVHLLTDDDDVIYIANSTILNSSIVNHTKRNQRKIIIEFSVVPNQIEGLNELERYLEQSLKEWKSQILADSAQLRVVAITTTTVNIKFQLILQRPSRRLEKEIRRHLNWQIISYINEQKRTESLSS
ncbi:mechanosensitive ion channel family protein [Cesiribacter andamanensis]|uniref:Mechanosensitive ion channel n=1 Tax=Cesiribacter andamanensis AMV16 TaxID=1279009 RepID=M7N6K7_9BACT|nr:mechanosensitive ion channel domain-containing protein [Cesiribacter andamanensis]EMR02856.1 Mechanosensitive ion channel [Cesiribacter andamanensis AMV16]